MLDVRGLTSGYGSFEVLHGVSLGVPDNAVVTLLGHNGAGKSTLLKALYGLLRVWSGEVRFSGAPFAARGGSDAARVGIRYVPQEGNVFPGLSIADNLKLGAHAIRPDPPTLDRHLDEVFSLFPILRERRAAPARVLSGGERQMLALSMALMTRPRLLLLDEPSAGLAPIMAQRVFDAISRMRTEFGTTVLLVEQNVNEALRLAETAYVMQEGRIVFTAPAAEREAIIHHLWGLARTLERAEAVHAAPTPPSP